MKFVIALVSYLESLGYDTSSLRKSADGSKAIVHMQYAEILSKNLDTNSNVTIYDRVNPDFQALLASDEWNGNVTGTPNSFGDLAELAKYEARLTAQVTEAKTDMDNFQIEIAEEVTTAKEDLNAIVDNYQVTVNQQLEHKADQTQADNLQGQLTSLVLGAVGAGNNAEVVQARVNSVGTIFPTVKSHLDNIEKNITSGKTNLVLSDWEIGNIAGDGLNATSALRIRTIGYHPVTVGDTLTIEPQVGYYAYVRFYDANNVFKSSQTVTAPISITIPQPNMRVVIREEIETNATLAYSDKVAFETDFKLVGQSEIEARVETNESGILDLLAALEEGLFKVDVGSFEVGGLDLNTGAPYSANYYLRSVGFIDAQTYENLVVKIDGTGYRYMAFAYDTSFSYVTRQSGFTSSSQSEIMIKYPFYKIMLNISGNPTIPLSDTAKFKFYTIKNLSLTDTRPLKGQVGVMFGDSLTELSFGITEKIVSDVTGATVYNCGVAGSKMGCINPLDPDAIDELSGAMLVEAIVNQDFTNVWSGNNRLIASSGDDNTRIIETLESLNFADVDFVTFAHGHNDYHFDLPLGTITDTGKGTWYGAINYVISTLSSAYPNLKFYFFTPPFRARHSLGDGLSSDVQTNDNGIWLREFCEAEELACIKNHVPCKNMLNTSGINAFNHAYWLIDGLHGTDAGYKMLASKYAEFIINN